MGRKLESEKSAKHKKGAETQFVQFVGGNGGQPCAHIEHGSGISRNEDLKRERGAPYAQKLRRRGRVVKQSLSASLQELRSGHRFSPRSPFLSVRISSLGLGD